MATITRAMVRKALRSQTTITETAPGEYQVDFDFTGGYNLAQLRDYMFDDAAWNALLAAEKGEVLRAVLRVVFVILVEPD